ncbi:MAG TPA: hypothetical protein VFI28_08860 [Candidatus Limnocylindrales bacterium]|nr:hypothetical protein [Candidatus Limnocylindrales bacterium]
MSIIWHAPRATPQSGRRRGLAAAATATVLLALLVAPVLANEGPTKLFDPAVSPRSAIVGAQVSFAVSYRNREGSSPSFVRVRVAGGVHALARLSSSGTIHDGIRYGASLTLPTGTWPVVFEAADTRRFESTISAGNVTISAPAPTPRPTPVPTSHPNPTPAPTARPNPTPAPTVTARPKGTTPPDPYPTASATLNGSGTPGSEPSPSPGLATPTPGLVAPTPGLVTSGSNAPGDGSFPPFGGGLTADAESTGDGGPHESGGASAGDGWPATAYASAWLPPILGGSDLSPAMRVLSTTVTAAAGATVVISFALFGKRRRDGEPTEPDEVLQARAARPGEPADATLAAVAAPVDAELAMPRWRRPSLLEARRTDPSRVATTQVRLTFDHGFVDPVAGLERRRIRYRVVRLLDGPDELLASEIGLLDEGDEVQLAERSGSFWRVLCPDGRSGWVHRMVLGEVVGAAGTDDPNDVDEDVLNAFLASRAQAS